MRILIIGATGLLGSTLAPHLAARGHAMLVPRQAGPARADLRDYTQLAQALDGLAPDVIVNLAALANVDACEREPQAAYLSNVRIVEHLARWIREHAPSCHLLHTSTDQVYDGSGPQREDAVRLTNYYAFSKYAGELAAGADSTCLRINFFGPSQCPGRASLSDWLVGALTRAEPITVFDDVLFSPLSLGTLVTCLELAATRHRPGVFNLGAHEGMSKADFAFALAGALALPTAAMRRGQSSSLRMAAYRPKDMRMDCRRFEQTFGVRLPSLKQEILTMSAAYGHRT